VPLDPDPPDPFAKDGAIMKLSRWQTLSTEETLAGFGRTRLKGFGQPLIYERATLRLIEQVPTERLVPAQRYVLKDELANIFALEALFRPHGIDIYALTGTVLFWLDCDGEEEGPIPLAPPIIEESVEDGREAPIWLINDGMHRVTAARCRGRPITIILAEGVPTAWPYYALPLADGWAGVETLDAYPEGYQKKVYRRPDDYKALFRDFNAVFPGIQKQRPKTGVVG